MYLKLHLVTLYYISLINITVIAIMLHMFDIIYFLSYAAVNASE